jgi:hypothetical protein
MFPSTGVRYFYASARTSIDGALGDEVFPAKATTITVTPDTSPTPTPSTPPFPIGPPAAPPSTTTPTPTPTSTSTSEPLTAKSQPKARGTTTKNGKLTAKVNKTLTAQSPTWSAPDVKVTYTWYVNGKKAKIGTTFKIPATAAGKLIQLRATGTKDGHKTTTVNSVVIRVPKLSSTMATKAVKSKGKVTKIKVTVRATGLKPSGTITAKYGSKTIAKDTLVAANKGVKTLTLSKKLTPTEAKKIKITYSGNTSITGRTKRL